MKPNGERARKAIRAFYVAMIIAALMLVVKLITILVLTESIDLGIGLLSALQRATVVLQQMTFGALILCAVVFIQWFRRAYFNLHQLLPSTQMRYAEGWAAGAWFIPVFNLFGPFQIAMDLFRNSQSLLIRNEITNTQPRLYVVAGWWWGLWVTRACLVTISRQVNKNFDLLTTGAVLDALVSLCAIGAAYFAMEMIKMYAVMEQHLALANDQEEDQIGDYDNDDLLDSGI